MKIVFMGTPEFARANLVALAESQHEILAVVTGLDKPVGRHRHLQPTVVRREAERQGLPVLMPKSLRSKSFRQELAKLDADLLVVAAFRVLPPSLIGVARYGAINIHTSLLPKYRGAAPVNWAIINGETETGLTSFFLRETVDTGDIVHQQRVPITLNDTFDSLYERLCAATGPFLLKTLERIEKKEYTPVPQEDTQASYAPRIRPEDGLIDFGFPAENVRNFVRGMATRPGAYTFFRGKMLKVHFCEIAEHSGSSDTRPGAILDDRRRLLVQCNRSAVELTRVVPAGKREMNGCAFVNGYHPQAGEVLGERPVAGEVGR